MTATYCFVTSWNTCRPYTERGQRISVYAVHQDGELVAYYMADIDRKVDYHFAPRPADYLMGPAEVRAYVQWCYDFNRNYLPYRAWFDLGMYQKVEAGDVADYPHWEPSYV